uniref:Uncharacterized protein n=1 Tax=Anopheles farauti TaxID=69004 RepID=A0A182QCF5_9DIPT
MDSLSGKVWLNNEAQWHHPIAMAPGQPSTPIVSGSPMSTAAPPPLNMSMPPVSTMALHSSPHPQPPLYLNPTSLMSLREMMLQSPAGLSLLNADATGLGLLKRTMLESIPSAAAAPAAFPLGINPLAGVGSSSSSTATATATYSSHLPSSMIPTTVASLSQQQAHHHQHHHPLHHQHQQQQQRIKKERDESDVEMDDREEPEQDERPAKHRRAQSPTLPATLHRPQLSLSPFRSSPPSSAYYHRSSTQPSSAIDQGLAHRSATSAAQVSHQPHLYHAASGSATSATSATATVPSHQRHTHQRDSAERELNLNACATIRAKSDRELLNHSRDHPSLASVSTPHQHHHQQQHPPLHPPPFANRPELELFRERDRERERRNSDSDGERDAGGRKEPHQSKRKDSDDLEQRGYAAMAAKADHDTANEVQPKKSDSTARSSKSSSPGKYLLSIGLFLARFFPTPIKPQSRASFSPSLQVLPLFSNPPTGSAIPAGWPAASCLGLCQHKLSSQFILS